MERWYLVYEILVHAYLPKITFCWLHCCVPRTIIKSIQLFPLCFSFHSFALPVHETPLGFPTCPFFLPLESHEITFYPTGNFCFSNLFSPVRLGYVGWTNEQVESTTIGSHLGRSEQSRSEVLKIRKRKIERMEEIALDKSSQWSKRTDFTYTQVKLFIKLDHTQPPPNPLSAHCF